MGENQNQKTTQSKKKCSEKKYVVYEYIFNEETPEEPMTEEDAHKLAQQLEDQSVLWGEEKMFRVVEVLIG